MRALTSTGDSDLPPVQGGYTLKIMNTNPLRIAKTTRITNAKPKIYPIHFAAFCQNFNKIMAIAKKAMAAQINLNPFMYKTSLLINL